MSVKRAPGAGRKPRGPFKGKTATITTRIRPDTRTALEREAKKRGYSLSQEIERRLDASLHKSRDTPLYVQALAHAVTLLTTEIERRTGKRWFEDAFTHEALRTGIEALLFHFARTPDGQIDVPPKIEEAATRLQSPLRESFRNAALLGQMEAGSIITSIENAPSPTSAPTGAYVPDPFGFWQILRDVGSGWQRNQEVWNKETKR
jgi:hypothetical protein